MGHGLMPLLCTIIHCCVSRIFPCGAFNTHHAFIPTNKYLTKSYDDDSGKDDEDDDNDAAAYNDDNDDDDDFMTWT